MSAQKPARDGGGRTPPSGGRWTVLSALLVLVASPLAAGDPLAGRTLAEALRELSTGGLRVVYSSRLVRPQMRVPSEPRARSPRQLLDELLAPHGLAARPGPGGTLLVVAAPPRAEPPPSSASSVPPALGFEERIDVATAIPPAPRAGPASLSLEAPEVLAMPGALDDVFRALQTLPGVEGTGELGSGLSVLGGEPGHNLVVMDGVEIHSPHRLFGATSAFHPEAVESYELTAGAFSAIYGDRLSSMLRVETRSGTEQRALAGAAAVGVTDARLLLEGRLPSRIPGSWLVAGRRTYYDLVADGICRCQVPSFADARVKLALRPRPHQRLTLTALGAVEGTDFDASGFGADEVAHGFQDPDRVEVFTDGGDRLLAAGFETGFGVRGWSRTLVSLYAFDQGFALDGDYLSDDRVSFTRVSFDERGRREDQRARLDFERGVRVRDLALRQELRLALSERHQLGFGFDVHDLVTRWSLAVAGDRDGQAVSRLVGRELPDALDSRLASRRAGVWGEDRFQVSERLSLEAGLRLGWSDVNRALSLEPRLAAQYDAGGVGRFHAAAGLHAQSPGYEKLLQADRFVDLSQPRRLDAERALHLQVGLERPLGRRARARVEAFWRRFDDLIVGRLESEAERAVRLAEYDFPDALSWGLPSAPRVTSIPVNGASGRAQGVLVRLEKRAATPRQRWSGGIAYALTGATRSAYGLRTPFAYDRRHAVTASANLRVASWLELAGTFRYASGRPAAAPSEVRIAAAADAVDRDGDGDRIEWVPVFDDAGRLVFTPDSGGVAVPGGERLPPYARLDLRLTFRPRGREGRWLIYVEALNALDHHNAARPLWDVSLPPGAERPRMVLRELEGGLPRVPTFGVRFRF